MDRRPPVIDMTPDGSFRAPPRGMPLSTKLVIGGVLVAAACASFAVAALAIWVVSLVLPVAIIAGAVAWIAWKVKLSQARSGAVQPFGPRRNL